MTELPRVALVGRPNVGKSTLFNRLIGKREAVVSDTAGTTRDRLEREIYWEGSGFILGDMAGLEPSLENDTEITRGTQAQVERTLKAADLLVWVVDGREGLTPRDQQVYAVLQSLHKPLLLAVNKCDHPGHDLNQYDFASLVCEGAVSLSSIHGRGISELLDLIVAQLPEREKKEIEADRQLRLGIVGRPNVGKSTLLNRLAGEERSVVSGEAGTTRDAVDAVIPAERLFGNTFTRWQEVRLVDTAGIRRPGRVEQGIERWSLIRTLEAIEASEVVLLLLDAQEGLVHQDLQISQQVVESGRALILLLNKWDAYLAERSLLPGTPEEVVEQEKVLATLRSQAPFLYWVQVLFLSAQNGQNVEYMGKLVLKAFTAWDLSVEQDTLDILTEQLRRFPRLRNLKRVTYEHGRPPVFHLEVEGRELPHFSTIRFAENVLRESLQIGPAPIKIWAVPSLPRRTRG